VDLVTKYLVRIWPAGAEPPPMQQSEMSSPESAVDGQEGNDRAMIRSIRNWAQQHANGSAEQYRYEVCHDSMVAALAGGGSNRLVEQIASGTVDPVQPAT
jgi:hypothetical protein